MKIKCPKCEAAFKIDDSKIPEKGAYATCSKCQTRFHIKKAPKEQKEEIIPCPKCGHLNISSDTCASCGNVFSKEEKAKLSITIDSEI